MTKNLGWNLFTFFHTFINCGKTEIILNKQKNGIGFCAFIFV